MTIQVQEIGSGAKPRFTFRNEVWERWQVVAWIVGSFGTAADGFPHPPFPWDYKLTLGSSDNLLEKDHRLSLRSIYFYTWVFFHLFLQKFKVGFWNLTQAHWYGKKFSLQPDVYRFDVNVKFDNCIVV